VVDVSARAGGPPVYGFWFRQEVPRARVGINDFMGIYAGARLVGTSEQFNADAYLREQVRATGWSAPSILYTRLPAFAFVVRPLGQMQYLHAYYVWEALSLACFAGFLVLWPAPSREWLLVAACWSFPLFADIFGGQDVAFVLLVLTVVWRWGPSRPFIAGAVLALAMLKFHLILLLPVFLIGQRRWRMLAGLCCGAAVVVAGCFAVARAGWVPEYLRFVLQGQTNPSLRAMPNLHGLLEGLPHSLGYEVFGALVVTVAVWLSTQRASFSVGLSATLIGSILVSHHSYPADMLLLLPALLTLAFQERPRWFCVLLLSPLPFLVQAQVPLAEPLPILLIALLVVLSVQCFKTGQSVLF